MLGYGPLGSAPLGAQAESVNIAAILGWAEAPETMSAAVIVAPLGGVSVQMAWAEVPETMGMVGNVAAPGTVVMNASWAEAAETFAFTSIMSGVKNMSYTPSPSRTVSIKAGSPAFVVTGSLWTMTNAKKPRIDKDPDEITDYTFDWTLWLAEVVDTIASVAFIVDSPLINVGYEFVGNKATVFVAGGAIGKKYPVTCRITTNSVPARIEDRTIYLNIISK